MSKGIKLVLLYVFFAVIAVEVYGVYKLFTLNWFFNVSFVTLLVYGFIAVIFNVALFYVAQALLSLNKEMKGTK